MTKRLHRKDKINGDMVVETKWHDSRLRYITEVRQLTTWAGPRGTLLGTYYGDTAAQAEENHSAGILAAAGELGDG